MCWAVEDLFLCIMHNNITLKETQNQSSGGHLVFLKAGLSPATLSKKRLWHRCFTVNFANFLKTLSL